MATIACFWIEKRGEREWAAADGRVFESPHAAPAGALYDAPWLRESGWRDEPEGALMRRYDDGLTVVVITPDGPWVIDGPSFDGKQHRPCPWTRSGDPRRPETFSVTPSIHFVGRYPAFLRAGKLVDV